MARGPSGISSPDELTSEESGLNRLELELTRGLEQVIDGALAGYRGSAPFAYGIHQTLSPRMREVLASRYLAAGWGDVRVTEGATGASVIVLHREP